MHHGFCLVTFKNAHAVGRIFIETDHILIAGTFRLKESPKMPTTFLSIVVFI